MVSCCDSRCIVQTLAVREAQGAGCCGMICKEVECSDESPVGDYRACTPSQKEDCSLTAPCSALGVIWWLLVISQLDMAYLR